MALMVEYDNLRDSISFIRSWFIECASSGPIDPIERFTDELGLEGVDNSTPRAEALNDHRFRVSRFFVRIRKLVRAGYLTEKLVSEGIGGEAIEEVFLGMVDPLDAAKAGHNYGAVDRLFYTELLKRHPRTKRSGEKSAPSGRSPKGIATTAGRRSDGGEPN
jgi:hypothetical protein